MSYSSTADGRVALYAKGELSLFDPATGETTPAGTTGGMRVNSIEAGPDGEIYVASNGRFHRFVDGVRSDGEGWPRPAPGDRPRMLDGWWWGYSWHGTIRRSDMLLNPSPGVVLGGASGSFIGHLDENPDINNTTGIDLLKPRMYVGTGEHGVVQTLEWDPSEACLKIRRRLGALDSCPGLAIDAKGRIFCGSGNWEWNDTPVSPIRHGVPPFIAGQPCVIGAESVLAPCWVYTTRPSVFAGTMDKELSSYGLGGPLAFSKNVAALAVWRENRQNWMVVAESDGAAHASRLGGDNRPANNGAIQMELSFSGPVGRLTSLAVKPSGDDSKADALLGKVFDFSADDPEAFDERRRSCHGNVDQARNDPDAVISRDWNDFDALKTAVLEALGE